MKTNTITSKDIKSFADTLPKLPETYISRNPRTIYGNEYNRYNATTMAERFNNILQMIKDLSACVTLDEVFIYITHKTGQAKLKRDLFVDNILMPEYYRQWAHLESNQYNS
jgi:hypothetical protein